MRIVADADIPFLRGRLEPFAEMTYVAQDDFAPEVVRDADAMIIRTRTRCDRALLEGSRVRFIATATIGMDQFNLEDCAALGIRITNAPGCNAPAVSQYVWSSLLNLNIDPAKITIGVVGHGNVGTIVAEWGRLLGARVLLCDPFKKEDCDRRGVMPPVEYLPLEEVARQADVLTLHTPMTRSGKHPTYHLLGERELELMHDGAIVINAARGPVADNAALAREVSGGRLRAIIDCWEGEPHMQPELLDAADIATCHIAGYSIEGKQRATRMALQAVGEFFGFSPDLSGLATPYKPKTYLNPDEVRQAFDPFALTAQLRANPDAFDTMRAAYEFRPET